MTRVPVISNCQRTQAFAEWVKVKTDIYLLPDVTPLYCEFASRIIRAVEHLFVQAFGLMYQTHQVKHVGF